MGRGQHSPDGSGSPNRRPWGRPCRDLTIASDLSPLPLLHLQLQRASQWASQWASWWMNRKWCHSFPNEKKRKEGKRENEEEEEKKIIFERHRLMRRPYVFPGMQTTVISSHISYSSCSTFKLALSCLRNTQLQSTAADDSQHFKPILSCHPSAVTNQLMWPIARASLFHLVGASLIGLLLNIPPLLPLLPHLLLLLLPLFPPLQLIRPFHKCRREEMINSILSLWKRYQTTSWMPVLRCQIGFLPLPPPRLPLPNRAGTCEYRRPWNAIRAKTTHELGAWIRINDNQRND